MAEQSLQRIVTWGKISGILLMIVGGIYGLLGAFAFLIGAIPGIIMVYLGYLIYKTGKSAETFMQTKENVSLAELLDNYGKYLMIQGILMFISIGLVILGIIISIFTFFMVTPTL